jgi:cell division protein FtsI/penicillin-binding protein 2
VGEPDGDTLALRAAVLALDAATGDILACASLDRPGADSRTEVSDPCVENSGIHPGSTFKLAVAAAALGSDDPAVASMVDGHLPAGLIRGGPRSGLEGARLPSLPLRPDSGRGRRLRSRLVNHRRRPMPVDTTLEDALRSSSNTWFGYAGLLLHRPLREGWGGSGIADAEGRREAWSVAGVVDAAGFGRRIDLGLGRTGTGGAFPATAVEGDAAWAARSIGQGDVTATPLGIALLLAPAVSKGWVPVPRFSRDRPLEARRVLDPEDAERLREALHAVVRSGTARRAFSDHPRPELVLGKTGSAHRIDGNGVPRTDAWFAGAVVPPDGVEGSPVVVVAVLPGAGLGGRSAAEVVDALSRDLIALRGWRSPIPAMDSVLTRPDLTSHAGAATFPQ